MCLELEWKCRVCGERWISDFHQLVCVECGGEDVKLSDQELVRPRRNQSICLGDIMLSSTTQPETTGSTVTR